ncbi:hypothetical protein R5W24_002625 [Gemmata sp. JC717]|uniref:hypothetical protein n=1 Tax=Gemmata algarum TaxID=2975278 RepID=UPI0021BB1E0D|nr:hypothetical protein [Gemmata algarum]MDY3553522.1 hypothetical protein [Gemmata algarum]
MKPMSTPTVLDREEYIEQAYLFRTVRERVADNQPAQEVFQRVADELLSTTRLPYAVQFVASELKHTGLLANGFAKLPHYFTAFQAFVVQQAEDEKSRLPMPTAFLILEREAAYRANQPTRPGLFVYQFETIARNRLGYIDGLEAMARDPFYDADWRGYFDQLRRLVGEKDFSDLVYTHSELFVAEERRRNPAFEPRRPVIFGEKEGKIAKASRTRDPLYLFAALQRQLGYPEVPRYRVRDDATTKMEILQTKLRDLEMRLKLVEGELRGSVDLSQFGKPDLLREKDD